MKYLYIMIMCVALSGCSSLDLAKGIANGVLGEQSGISVDAQIGDKTANVGTNDNSQVNLDDVEGNVTMTSTKSDKSFGTTDTININEGPNLLFMCLLIIGWLLPSPNQMFSEVKSWFTKPT